MIFTADGPLETADGLRCWPIAELIENGLMWAINTYVLHPRGYAALGCYDDEDCTQFVGLAFVASEGGPLAYPEEAEAMGRLFNEAFPVPHPREGAS